MMMKKKKCRFCRRPAVDGGVFLPDVDRDKLSRWWSVHLDTELDEQTLKDAWCCQQCLWDARLMFKFGTPPEANPDCKWWPLRDDLFFKKYLDFDLKDPILNVAPLQESDFGKLQVRVQKFSCKFCEEKFYLPSNLTLHEQNDHGASGLEPFRRRKLTMAPTSVPNDKRKNNSHTFKCTFRGCSKLLPSESTLKQHLKSVHKITSDVAIKCKICKRIYRCKVSFGNHMRMKHPEARKYKNESHKKVVKYLAKMKEPPKTFDCFWCAEKFGTQMHLGKHIKLHHQTSAVKCKSCKFLYFKTKIEMEAHFEKEHQFKCTVCPFVSTSKQSLFSHFKKKHQDAIKCGFFHCMFHACSNEEIEKHVEESHDRGKTEKSAECIFCKRRFVDLRHRGSHTRRLHAKIAIQCDKQNCLHFVKTEAELEEHKKEAHKKVEKQKKSTVCLYCNKQMWDNSSYVGHLKQVHPSQIIRCTYHTCFTFFKTKEELKIHLKERHFSNFTCDFCGFGAARKDYMTNHISRYHLSADRKCPECPKILGSYADWNAHILYYHRKSAKCVHCGEVSTNLNRHVVTAKCPVCEKPFPCKNLLSIHKVSCKKVYRCSFCDRKFKIESELSYHLNDKHKLGAEWRGYECKKCKNVFNSIQDLRHHRLKNHPSFVKTCKLCKKGLWGRASLTSHLANVHNIGDFWCKKCDKRFAQKHLFNSHLKYNHGKNDPKLQFIECDFCKTILKKSSFYEHYRIFHY